MRLVTSNPLGPRTRGPSFFLALRLLISVSFVFIAGLCAVQAQTKNAANTEDWVAAVKAGDFDKAVAAAQGGQTALGHLMAEADRLNLHKAPLWRALLHYQPTFGGVKSQVDSPWFFQSDRGKTNSQAEMHATLAAFFKQEAKAPLRVSAYCRFIARKDWLEEQLGDTFLAVPKQSCPERAQFEDFLDAHTLTLVFPTSHPSSPASALGHTLIRVDKKDQSQDEKLLNMSINFAAEIPKGVSSLVYTFGGLGGLFSGKFRLLPYHTKLREYRQIENRDTWEYPLKLSQEQVDLVISHAYEMLIAEFDYYFFSENCSYHLLGLLDVAFADDPVAAQFNLWTIPLETIKALDDRGLIADELFVPSDVRALKQRELELTTNEQRIALKAASEGIDSVGADLNELTDERAALVLDTLGDYNRYTRLKEDSSASGLNENERAVLSRRSKLGVRTVEPEVPAPNLAPQLGHDISRVTFGTRTFNGGVTTFELGYRVAYHDLQDPSAAYGTRAAIELFDLALAHDSEDESLFIRRLTLISIESLEPRRGFFKPYSWRTKIEYERETNDSNHRLTFTSGRGISYRLGGERGPLVFGLLEGDLLDDSSLPNNRQAIQLGTRLGVHWEPQRRLRLGLEWEYRELIGGTRRFDSEVSLWATVTAYRNGALVLEAKQRHIQSEDTVSSLGAEWRLYF